MLGSVLFAALFLLDGLVESKILTGAFFESHWGYHMLNVLMSALLAVGVLGLFARQARTLREAREGWVLPFLRRVRAGGTGRASHHCVRAGGRRGVNARVA